MRPAETANGVLYISCYRYYRRLKNAGELGRLAEHLEADANGRWNRHKGRGTDNVLRLLERPGAGWLLTPSRRGRIATELDFADHFDIHFRLLLPFLYETGSHQLVKQTAKARTAMPWISNYQTLSRLLREERTHEVAAAAAPDGES